MSGQFVQPQNTTSDIASIVDAAKEKVEEKFEMAMEYADGALSTAEAFLDDLANAAKEANFVITSLTDLSIAPLSYEFNIGDAPASPEVSLQMPNLPALPNLLDITIDAPAIPTFDVVRPEIVIPEAPSTDLPNPPSDIPSLSPIALPEKPAVVLPDEPTFYQIVIPEIPTASFPVFDEAAPTENLVVPPLYVGIQADSYESAILNALKAKLLQDILNGGTGLGADVEEQIWRREEERARLAQEEAMENIAAEWSKRGFSLPDGVLAANLAMAEIDYRNKRLDRARDVAIKQAELAFQNTQFVIQQGISLENILINWTNMVAQRTFESTRAMQDAAMAVYNASVSKLNAQLETYKTKAMVYEARIRAELAKAEFYKAQVQAAGVAAEVNKAFAELYRLQIAGVEALIGMYKSEMEAARIVSDIDRTRIEAFRAQIEAYVSRVNAKTAEFHLYSSRIDGEKAKVQIYATEVEGYEARVDAAKVEASIYLEQAKTQTEVNKDLITRYTAELERYKAELQGRIEEMNALVKVFEVNGQIYRHKADAQAAVAEVDVKAQEAAIRAHLHQAELFLKEAEVNLQSVQHSAQVKVEAAKGGAHVAAQLAAGMFSGVAIQAQLSAHASVQKGYSGAEQVSETYPHKAV